MYNITDLLEENTLILFLKTKKFIPNEFHNSFFDVDFKKLYDQGFRIILSDLDNTLISYDEDKPTKEILDKYEVLESIGFELVLISNNVPSRISTFTENTKIKGFANARKPLLIGIKKALAATKLQDKSKTIIIGDQLMTDIWAANRFGSHSILVNPIKKKTEKWYTKFNRRIEVKMLQKIKTKYPNKHAKLNLDKRV